MLVETEHLYFQATQHVLASVGISLSQEQYIELFLVQGRGAWHLAEEYGIAPHEIDQISDGRTDLVFEYLSAGQAAKSTDKNGVPLIKWCAYYGDVSAIRYLLANGESLASLGENLDLNGAALWAWGNRKRNPSTVRSR